MLRVGQLKKSGSSLSQLQIDELIFAINSQETSQGSALAFFRVRDYARNYLTQQFELLMVENS